MSLDFSKIPQELKNIPQWVCWKTEERDGKKTKLPINPHTGSLAAVDKPQTWGTYQQALTAAKSNGNCGIGFVFTEADPYAGIDIDGAIEGGEIHPQALEVIRELETYAEFSQSGKGLHIIAKAKLPPGRRRKGHLEMYDCGRFFVMTGTHLEGTPTVIENRQTELTAFHARVFGQEKEAIKTPGPSPTLSFTDTEIIKRARGAKNGAKFDRLMAGDTSEYEGDDSAADLALCSMLAYWTRDPGQIDRIFRTSRLYRAKWDRQDYRDRTITKALTTVTETFNPSTEVLQPESSKKSAKKRELSIPSGFNLTDIGNGKRLVARHGQILHYCYPWSRWLIYDDRRWLKDDLGEIDRLGKDTVQAMYVEAAQIPDQKQREAIAQHALRSESEAKRKAMISSAQSESGIPLLPEHLDQDPWLFNVLNGTIDLRTGELRPHRREDLITKLAQVIYDATAECPTWWNFLERIFDRNFDLILFLQKAVGYALTGITWEQCLFFLYGLGANGKSTLIEIIQALLSDYATRTSTETFLAKKGNTIPNDVAALRGARFVSAVEVEAGRRLAEVLVKEMTGGDRLSARFMRAEWFEFKPEFKIFLAANHKPVIRGTDWAIWRRIHLIPFKVQIPREEQDKQLPEKLKRELSGILNWAIDGCFQWQHEGLTPPQSVQEATQEYREEMDIVGSFLAECCIVDTGAFALASELYKKYTSWGEESGEKKPFSQKVFGLTLAERGFERGRGQGGKTVWKGIGVTD